MTALAEVTDLEDRLGRVLTDAELARAGSALADASAAAAAYARTAFVPTPIVRVYRLTDSYVVLIRPVLTITAVEVPTTLHGDTWQAVPYQFDGLDRLVAYGAGGPYDGGFLNFPADLNPGRTVRVTYSSGYDPIPDDVIGVVAAAAIRQLQSPAIVEQVGPLSGGYGVAQETAGPFARTFTPAAMSGAVYLLDSERVILDQYRIGASSHPVSSW